MNESPEKKRAEKIVQMSESANDNAEIAKHFGEIIRVSLYQSNQKEGHEFPLNQAVEDVITAHYDDENIAEIVLLCEKAVLEKIEIMNIPAEEREKIKTIFHDIVRKEFQVQTHGGADVNLLD
jgi:hypothetical protein